MAMVVVDASCLKQAGSQPKSCGLVWGSAAAWRCCTFTRWTEWTLAMTWSWWQHYKYRRGYYSFFFFFWPTSTKPRAWKLNYYYYYYYYVDDDDDDDDYKEIHIAAIGLLLSLSQTLTGPKPTTVHHSMKRTTCDVRRFPHTHTSLCTKTSSQEIQRTCVSEQLTVTSWMSSSVTLLSKLPNSILYRVVEKKRGQGPPCMRHIAKATPAATYRRFSNAV